MKTILICYMRTGRWSNKSTSYLNIFFLNTIRFIYNILKNKSWGHYANFTWLQKGRNLSFSRAASTGGPIDPANESCDLRHCTTIGSAESRDLGNGLPLIQLSHMIYEYCTIIALVNIGISPSMLKIFFFFELSSLDFQSILPWPF